MAILLVAVLLRAWGINYGLPGLNHPDEPNKVAYAQRIIRTGDLNPHYFDKGSLLIYSTAAVQLAYYGWGAAAGWFEDFDDVAAPRFLIYGTGWTPHPGTFLLARWLTVLLGTACVLLLYLCTVSAVGDARAGLAAALMMAVAPIPVENSRFITVNTYVVFFCLVVVVLSLRLYREGRIRDYLAAGLAVGFATGSKYPAGLVLLVPIVAHFVGARRGPRNTMALLTLPPMALVGFLMTTPYALLAPQEFMADVIFQQQHYTGSHWGMEGEAAAYYAGQLWNVEGSALCVLSVAGAALLALRHRAAGAVLLVFPLVYLASIAWLPVRNARTLLPVLPFLYLAAGVAVAEVWKRLDPARPPILAAALLAFLFALSFPAQRTMGTARLANAVVASEQARRWIEKHVPADSRVALEAYSPYVDPERYHVEAVPFLIRLGDSSSRRRFDYMIASKRSYGRFLNNPKHYPSQAAAYERLFSQLEEIATFADFGTAIRIFKVPHDPPRQTPRRH